MTGRYYGGKWGVYLRAPDLWFELLDRYGHRLVPLGEIADVWRGTWGGKDCFFYPRDASAECLAAHPDPADFEAQYGLPRADVASGRVKLVHCGEERGEIRPIEAEYLEPEVHNLMEIRSFTVSPADCSRMILLVDKPKSDLKGTHVLHYINWGEEQQYHQGASCAGRVSGERPWYDLTGHVRGAMFWSKIHKYRHIIPLNDQRLTGSNNLYDVLPKHEIGPSVLAALLNSSLVVLSKFQYGRYAGTEGTLKTEVVDVNMTPVADPGQADPEVLLRLEQAFVRMRRRQPISFLSERTFSEPALREAGRETELNALPNICELDMPDRRDLDDAVFEMLGVESAQRRRELIEELYACLRELFERNRVMEWRTNINKRIAKRRGAAKPSEVAAEILAEIKAKEPHLLQAYDPGFLDPSKPFDTYELPSVGEPSQGPLAPHIVEFRRGKKLIGAVHTKNTAQDDLLVFLARSGVRGLVRVPHDEEECRRVYERYSDFAGRRDERLRKLIQDRTADEEMQGRISDILTTLLTRSS